MILNNYKTPEKVRLDYLKNGDIIPIAIVSDNGDTFFIDGVIDCKMIQSQNGKSSICYTCISKNKQLSLVKNVSSWQYMFL
jgi:hypothetical protein